MLQPLSGVDPKEADDTVREALAESIAQIAGTEKGKELLQRLDAVELLKKGYEYEECPGVCGALEHTARLLMFEEIEDPDADQAPAGGMICMG